MKACWLGIFQSSFDTFWWLTEFDPLSKSFHKHRFNVSGTWRVILQIIMTLVQLCRFVNVLSDDNICFSKSQNIFLRGISHWFFFYFSSKPRFSLPAELVNNIGCAAAAYFVPLSLWIFANSSSFFSTLWSFSVSFLIQIVIIGIFFFVKLVFITNNTDKVLPAVLYWTDLRMEIRLLPMSIFACLDSTMLDISGNILTFFFGCDSL